VYLYVGQLEESGAPNGYGVFVQMLELPAFGNAYHRRVVVVYCGQWSEGLRQGRGVLMVFQGVGAPEADGSGNWRWHDY